MRAAAVQLTSTADRERNLATADRLTRAAAAAGAELVVLPEKWAVLGTPEETAAGAEPFDGPALTWARATARELGIDLVAGSIAERVAGRGKGSNTSVHVGPDGEVRAVYRKIHMFDVEVGGRTYRESEHEDGGEEIVLSETADGVELGLTVCYDLRFPELYRILAVRGARVITVPAAFTLATTRDHWEVLLRARAIEDQAFVIAANQVGEHARGYRSGGRSMIVDPWGVVWPRRRTPRRSSPPSSTSSARPTSGARCPRWPTAGRTPTPGPRRSTPSGDPARAPVDKRRMILDAAVRVFARQGFHTCRVSDIADEAGVAYGLVYHYFQSKDEVLDTLFLDRWDVLLAAIREVDASGDPARAKLRAIASFIIESYRHDPDLMKVIIVEVTRAANSFGAAHLPKINEAFEQIGGIVEQAQRRASSATRSAPSLRRWRSTARSSRSSRAGSSDARRGRRRPRAREGLRRRDHLRRSRR